MQNDAESRKLKFVTQSQKCSKKVDGRGKKKLAESLKKQLFFKRTIQMKHSFVLFVLHKNRKEKHEKTSFR